MARYPMMGRCRNEEGKCLVTVAGVVVWYIQVRDGQEFQQLPEAGRDRVITGLQIAGMCYPGQCLDFRPRVPRTAREQMSRC